MPLYANDPEAAAAEYRKRGWSPIPLGRRSKEPKLGKGHPYLSRRATDEEFAKFKFTNVGIVTGKVSGVFVLDDDDDGQTLKEKGWHVPLTPTVKTSRGHQYYLRCPEEGFPTFKITPKTLETKADGGYAVGPPSIHPDGPTYEWVISPNDAELADPPQWLIEQARQSRRREPLDTAAALDGVPEGERDETLFRLACKLRGADVPYEFARELLLQAGSNCTPPVPERDSLAKLDGAYTRYQPDSNGHHAGPRSPGGDAFQDLVGLPDPEEFPLHALPLSVRIFVREAAASIGCPVDYVGLGALMALSAAIGDTRRIVVKKDWTEGASIYGMIVGGPASKKTPAMNMALRPVRERQMALKTEYERQKEEHEGALREYEKAKKDDPDSAERKPEKPILGRTYGDDTTVERLADILNENRRGVLIIKDELSGWLGRMNQYKAGGKGGDRQFWLSAHTNQPVSVDRKSADEPVIVPRPWVSVIGGIQPDVLPDFGTERGDGLIDRFIAVYPKPLVVHWSDDEISEEAHEAYKSILGRLYRLKHVSEEEDPFPSKVPMTTEAKDVFIAEYNKLHEELLALGFPERLKPAWGKLEAYFARFALILALARVAELAALRDSGDSNDSNDSDFRHFGERVVREDMEGAALLLGYFKNHIRRVYTGLYGDSWSARLEGDLRDFLISKGHSWEGTASELR